MKVNANTIRPGNTLKHKDKLWVVVKIQHTQPGKGGAYVQAELKGLLDGTKLNERFRSSEDIERVYFDESDHQFLFEDGTNCTFMDTSTYDQVEINKEMVGEPADFLQEGMIVKICMHEGSPISVELPDTIIMNIVEADGVVKGQTASSSYKPAILENGRRIMVPPHIESDTKVVVNTADGSYVEKAK